MIGWFVGLIYGKVRLTIMVSNYIRFKHLTSGLITNEGMKRRLYSSLLNITLNSLLIESVEIGCNWERDSAKESDTGCGLRVTENFYIDMFLNHVVNLYLGLCVFSSLIGGSLPEATRGRQPTPLGTPNLLTDRIPSD